MGTNRKPLRQILKEGKLHLQGVLALVRLFVLAEEGAGVLDLPGQLRIDLGRTQRRLPESLGENGLRFAVREMPGSDQDKSPRQLQASINGSGNAARNIDNPRAGPCRRWRFAAAIPLRWR